MPAPYSGKCRCGAIKLRVEAEPVALRQCWCRQCQQVSGGGAANNAIFPAEAVKITGERNESSYTAASGNTLTSEFCRKCGTPVLARSSARPQFRTVRFGMLDVAHGLRPEMAIWTSEAPDWALIDPELEQFEHQPPPPPAS